MYLKPRRRPRSSAELEPLESRRHFAVGTVTTLAAPATLTFGQDLTIKTRVTQSKGAFTPHGVVQLYGNGTNLGFSGRVDHLGRYNFVFTAGDSFSVGTATLSARYVGVPTKFAASRSATSTTVVSLPKNVTTRPDGLQISIVTPGSGTATAGSGDTVYLEDTGYGSDGTVAAQTAGSSTGMATLVVNANPPQTIAGFNEALVGMKVGEVRDVFIPASLAYNNGITYRYVIKLDSIS